MHDRGNTRTAQNWLCHLHLTGKGKGEMVGVRVHAQVRMPA